MGQSLARIYLHIIFSTKDRHPWLADADLRAELHRYMGGILRRLECSPLIIGGVEDHVHTLCGLNKTVSVSELIKELKRGSSVWIKTASAKETFAWQNGFGAFSLGMSQVALATRYIAEQEKHHKKVTFQEELRKFLNSYKISFDERYLWD